MPIGCFSFSFLASLVVGVYVLYTLNRFFGVSLYMKFSLLIKNIYIYIYIEEALCQLSSSFLSIFIHENFNFILKFI